MIGVTVWACTTPAKIIKLMLYEIREYVFMGEVGCQGGEIQDVEWGFLLARFGRGDR